MHIDEFLELIGFPNTRVFHFDVHDIFNIKGKVSNIINEFKDELGIVDYRASAKDCRYFNYYLIVGNSFIHCSKYQSMIDKIKSELSDLFDYIPPKKYLLDDLKKDCPVACAFECQCNICNHYNSLS